MWKEKWDGLVWRSIFNDEKQRDSLFKFHRIALQVGLVLLPRSNCWIFLPALKIVGCFSTIWKAPFGWILFFAFATTSILPSHLEEDENSRKMRCSLSLLRLFWIWMLTDRCTLQFHLKFSHWIGFHSFLQSSEKGFIYTNLEKVQPVRGNFHGRHVSASGRSDSGHRHPQSHHENHLRIISRAYLQQTSKISCLWCTQPAQRFRRYCGMDWKQQTNSRSVPWKTDETWSAEVLWRSWKNSLKGTRRDNFNVSIANEVETNIVKRWRR